MTETSAYNARQQLATSEHQKDTLKADNAKLLADIGMLKALLIHAARKPPGATARGEPDIEEFVARIIVDTISHYIEDGFLTRKLNHPFAESKSGDSGRSDIAFVSSVVAGRQYPMRLMEVSRDHERTHKDYEVVTAKSVFELRSTLCCVDITLDKVESVRIYGLLLKGDGTLQTLRFKRNAQN